VSDLLPSDDAAFGHWLAGFIDGEGSFMIVRRTAPCCRFSLIVRDDDAAIMAEIADRTGFGRLRSVNKKLPDRPCVGWEITSKADALALIDFLERFPLRAKKARDFAFWREAVLLWIQRSGPGVPSKLTAADVALIRSEYAAGVTQGELGKRFGLDRGYIGAVLSGKNGIRLADSEPPEVVAQMVRLKEQMEAGRRYSPRVEVPA
jgi:hypothetical protein